MRPAPPASIWRVLVVTRPVDQSLLATIGSYAGVRVTPAPQAVVKQFKVATASGQAGNGVLNQFGSTFTDGTYRSAYLGVYDTDGYRSGLVKVSMERSAVSGAVSEIRNVAIAALLVALAAATVAALLAVPAHQSAAPRTGSGRRGDGRRRDQAGDPRARQ